MLLRGSLVPELIHILRKGPALFLLPSAGHRKGKRRTINVALVGNPNCGKTSLFNIASGAHEHVGNYSGVTVDAKEGFFDFQGYHFRIVDLPGTYSLSAYTPEELYVRKHIIEETPDVIINVADSSNLERNFYLSSPVPHRRNRWSRRFWARSA